MKGSIAEGVPDGGSVHTRTGGGGHFHIRPCRACRFSGHHLSA